MPQVQLKEIKKTLRKQFQMSELRPGQEEVIRSVLAKKNTLAIMPTGGGKSLCYQLPALHLSGKTLIISPLISLMKDQKEKMDELGVEALEFNSAILQSQQSENLERLAEEGEEFIYATPERLENAEFLQTLKQTKIDFVVIDEAHCVSQWGHDFRPSYLNISAALKSLNNPPVLALTATATPEVVDDIKAQLKLKDLEVFRLSIHRENLYFEGKLCESEEDKKKQLLNYLKDLEGSGIIYASTIKIVNELCDYLNENGISAISYHGKLKVSEKNENQNEFMNFSPRIMVATNAFGMGVDKSDIRYVIHYNFPGSLEAYYQEAGRAGRDGQPAKCILLYLKKDKSTQALFIARKYPSTEDLIQIYQKIESAPASGQLITKSEIENSFTDIPKRKVSLLLAYLKHLNVIKEKRTKELQVSRSGLNSIHLEKLANSYKEREESDKEKLKRVIMYAQSALCRWKILANYFQEETTWDHCFHCDNCEKPVLDQVLSH